MNLIRLHSNNCVGIIYYITQQVLYIKIDLINFNASFIHEYFIFFMLIVVSRILRVTGSSGH